MLWYDRKLISGGMKGIAIPNWSSSLRSDSTNAISNPLICSRAKPSKELRRSLSVFGVFDVGCVGNLPRRSFTY